MQIPLSPPPGLWTSFRREDADLLAADGDAGRVSGETPLTVRLWGSEILHARVARDAIRVAPALLQWRRDGAYAVPVANASAALSPSGRLATRAADLADPAAALAHLMAALDEALGAEARRRTGALLALARLRLAESGAPSAILRLRQGGRPVLDAPSAGFRRQTIPLAAGRHAGPALKALLAPSDRVAAALSETAPTSPSLPFGPVWDRGIHHFDAPSAHQRLALRDDARAAVEAAGVEPRHLGL